MSLSFVSAEISVAQYCNDVTGFDDGKLEYFQGPNKIKIIPQLSFFSDSTNKALLCNDTTHFPEIKCYFKCYLKEVGWVS